MGKTSSGEVIAFAGCGVDVNHLMCNRNELIPD
jgi:hypothetical protein